MFVSIYIGGESKQDDNGSEHSHFNTSKYRRIEFEYHLKDPPIDSSSADFQILCDPTTGQIIATTQEPTSIYHYSYDLHLFEERYNILEFHSGTAELLYQN